LGDKRGGGRLAPPGGVATHHHFVSLLLSFFVARAERLGRRARRCVNVSARPAPIGVGLSG